jgi:hypothetical protein
MANVQPQLENDARAVEAYFDKQTRSIVVRFQGGTILNLPVDKLQGLANASDRDIAGVELMPQGAALHWENLDLDFSIAGLTAGVFGTRAWMAELGRKGGSVTTEAKATAARANGRRGGRPRKLSQPQPGVTSRTFKLVPMPRETEPLPASLGNTSHMATGDLIRYESGLCAAANDSINARLKMAQAELIKNTLSGVDLAGLKPSQPGDMIWTEVKSNADLALAA